MAGMEILGVKPRDAVEFVALMRRLKQESQLTYRQLEERAAARGEILARSTLADVLGGKRLPRPELLTAFVHACGRGSEATAWLDALDVIARGEALEHGLDKADPAPTEPAEAAPTEPVRHGQPSDKRFKGHLLPLTMAAAFGAVTASVAWMLIPFGRPAGDVQHTESTTSGIWSTLPRGWVRLRPVTALHLCLTDGRVQNYRYVPLVAVQRPCDEVAPQTTLLEPTGEGNYRIQWHHPDYGRGCLKALSEGPGAGLLEPRDDCEQGSSFEIEPSGLYGSGQYVLRVKGQGCVGIVGSSTAEGTEAEMEPCVGKGGQVFVIDLLP